MHTNYTILSVLFFLAFLVCEPLRPEILVILADRTLPAWPIFTGFRLLFLMASASLFYLALPESEATLRRMVPVPTRGLDPLLSLRAYACMLVIAGHALAVVFVPSGMPERLERSNPIWLLMGSPWAGVWIFFVLSGYLMGKGFYSGRYMHSRESVRKFYWNRAMRIVPMYYAVLLIVSVLVDPQIYTANHLWEIAALATFSLHLEAPTPVISALWSIQTEMAFYAMAPLLIFVLTNIARVLPPWLLIAMIAALGFAYRWWVLAETQNLGWLSRVYVPLIANIDLFMIGILANWIVPGASRILNRTPTLPIGLAIMSLSYIVSAYVFVQASYGSDHATFSWYAQNVGPTFTASIALSCILLFESHVASGKTGGPVSRRAIRLSQFTGVLSYALYIWHEPVLLRLRTVAAKDLTTWEAIAAGIVAVALSITIAFFAFRLIEAPFEKRKRDTSSRMIAT
ncbi:hypothetical protein A6U86_19805 [Rhizobium sp. AC27/96]|uniref:acyltransferase family protein n=1 Tax=Rhizobium sp. AC27/96 TaxID=1841653 RepID=UPI0008293CC0|nr:acyltransferase [Rhizobium sp. AC27/96]OCI93275.1 hypothetical protein A6U86_19805 [Rhizobium sp. AC27/96]